MKAAIFDMDGLLINSEPLWRRAEREVFAKVGLILTDEDCRRTTGLRSDEVVGFWFERRPWTGTARDDVVRDLEETVIRLISKRGCALPGVRRTIDLVRRAGLRLAIASSSSPEIIEVVLATLGLTDTFEVACSGADEIRGKPDPAVYLTTVGRLGLPAADCVAFEDSVAGVAAAKAAAVFTVAVPDVADFDDPCFDIADVKLASLEAFDPSLLV